MKEPKWLYRLESRDPNNGLWYNAKGEKVWSIETIVRTTKNLPMEYDKRYHVDGRNWFSSCSNRRDLIHWYSLEEAFELIYNHNFVFTKYLATEYIEYEKETVFIKETALERQEVDIKEIFCTFCYTLIENGGISGIDKFGTEFNYTNLKYCPECGRKLEKYIQ